MWTCINMQKTRLFYWFVLDIWVTTKSCNLIGSEHFGPYLWNENITKYEICARIQQITSVFIIAQIQWKLMTKSLNKFKKPCFSFSFFFLIGIDSMQGWTATTRHGVTRKRSTKRLKHTGNLFTKNLQLIGVC